MKLERVLTAVLGLAVVDCAYLAWRYVALHADWVVPGTGICSWTANIDCDIVLCTPEARAFFVPNALLGLGFFLGTFLFWTIGRRRYPEHGSLIVRIVAVWLAVATLFTFRFFQLLVTLPALCPFCPWNHVWTWIALAVSIAIVHRTPREPNLDWRPLAPFAAMLIAQFFAWFALWGLLLRAGVLRP
jgi:uncharacterized membrane protein